MNTNPDPTDITVDIIIFGGGIAGLWALNQLRHAGYAAILLETHTLGGGQTLQSQGIIHGGIKYALSGFLNRSANAISTMPERWQRALNGDDTVDLRSVNILSPHQLLWSTGSIASDITNFFASKALNSRIQKVSKTLYPPVLNNPHFKGQVYQLSEIVLDTPSLMNTLKKPYEDFIFKIDPTTGYTIHRNKNYPHNIGSLTVSSQNASVTLKAQKYIFAAGEGNETLIQTLARGPDMQRRPLQMTVLSSPDLTPFFGHCMDQSTNPRITITSHPLKNKQWAWYLGGQLAEEGANRTEAAHIEVAKKELSQLFPWLNLTDARFASFFINRAEPKQPNQTRPDKPFLEKSGNAFIVWPTKLAFAPLLSDQILQSLQSDSIIPNPIAYPDTFFKNLPLARPSLATPPWELYLG